MKRFVTWLGRIKAIRSADRRVRVFSIDPEYKAFSVTNSSADMAVRAPGLSLICSFAAVLLMLGVFTGCESSGGGGDVHGSIYYGVGFSNPWYYGGYYDQGDIIVTPPSPPDRPDRPERPVHPEQPIARPSTSAARPMPSIPSTPRPMARPAGRR
jgi:hypothetical protein